MALLTTAKNIYKVPRYKRTGTLLLPVTKEQYLRGAHVAAERNWYSYHKTRGDKHGANTLREGLQINSLGTSAESILADYLGIPWDGALGNYQAADISDLFQVRCSNWGGRLGNHLFIYDYDKMDMPYILAFDRINMIEYVGWYYGWYAVDFIDENGVTLWGKVGRDYKFNVPQGLLGDMDDLFEIYADEIKKRRNK